MTSTPTVQGGLLRELTEAECWQRLADGVVGRVAYVVDGAPVILPMNYLARDGRVWFRTSPYVELASHLAGQQVAFEIDHVDETTHSGWSVLVRGRAQRVTDDDQGPRCDSPGPAPWPLGMRTLTFCVSVGEVTGRVLRGRDVRASPGHEPGSVQRSAGSDG